MRILITGGAGFVGSNLARLFREKSAKTSIVVLDNLHRRGSELNLPLLKKLNVSFVHGDIRLRGDLDNLDGNFDVFIEASAEPSVLAGLKGSPSYLLESNLLGSLNCLEFIRSGRAKRCLFLSTSRVYSMNALKRIQLEKSKTRLTPSAQQTEPGFTSRGVAESFSTSRSSLALRSY